MTRPRRHRNRKGTILVLAAFMLVVLFAVLMLAVDLGYLYVTQTQMQRTADAAAIAAVWELVDEDALAGNPDPNQLETNARAEAAEFAGYNEVLKQVTQLGQTDVVVGYLADPSDPNEAIDTSGNNTPNVVRVTVCRTDQQNGAVPLYFAPLLGIADAEVQTEATAALLYNFGGFQAPSNGGNLGMLPFALDQLTWDDMMTNGIGTDDWTWDEVNKEISSGADGILEVNLYPQGTGSPGNRGTVDIGSNNNSTADIARQITDGVTPADLAFHGGSLELDEDGELELNADTGISAGVKDELASIKGEPRIIPIFASVSGNGNNAQYVIIQFVGVRIMDVKLTGKMSGKRVIIQPANIITGGGIPSSATSPTSQFVYSPGWLIR